MRWNFRRGVGVAAAVVGLAAATGARPAAEPVRAEGVTDHVVVISIDGLRPDAIERYDAETLQRLMREGSGSLAAQTIFPSKTLPSHTSMLTGVSPEVHGITWNSNQTDDRGVVGVPTVFEVAHDAGLRTAAFFSKEKFRHLIRPGSLDHVQAPSGPLHRMATETVSDAVTYLRHERPNLLFVHIAEPDYAGHTIGWMSFAYKWAVRRADAAVATVLEAADQAYGEGGYTVILSADHGGHGRDHGSADPRDMTIPWITWGKGVDAGRALEPGVRTMDTAATALWLLGVAVPPEWEGRPVAQAYTPDARTVAASAAGR